MKVLMVVSRYDYGIPENGFSTDELHLVRGLKATNANVTLFDFPTVIAEFGVQIANEMLRTQFTNDDYDIVIYIPFLGTEIYEHTWGYVERSTKKVLWMFNDCWRYFELGCELCWAFDIVVTDDSYGVYRYNELDSNIKSVYVPRGIYSPWFIDSASDEKPIDVCFIGQNHGNRAKMITDIVKGLPNSVNVTLGGLGGEKVSWNQYVQAMCQSKIVLSPSQASKGGSYQIKLRTIEAMAAGALVLDDFNSDEAFNYSVHFDSVSSAIKQINYYLENPDAMRLLIDVAKEYVLDEHEYSSIFSKLFNSWGFDG